MILKLKFSFINCIIVLGVKATGKGTSESHHSTLAALRERCNPSPEPQRNKRSILQRITLNSTGNFPRISKLISSFVEDLRRLLFGLYSRSDQPL